MQLQAMIEQAVTGLGYELVDLETSPRGRLLRVFIDRPVDTGINVDDCALVSNHLTRLFAVENVDYDRLEVSSPGLDRPLKKPEDWQRFSGHEVQFKLRVPEGNQRNFSGAIIGLRDGAALVRIGEEERSFPMDNVEKARLVPKFPETDRRSRKK